MTLHGYTTPGTVLTRESDGTHPQVGEELRDFRGETATLRGWRPGSHPGSTGRVLVADRYGEREYFPSVFGCRVDRAR